MGFNSAPVIRALQDVLAVFRDFQFDHDEPAILSQSEEIYWSDSEFCSTRSSKLRVEWRYDQTRIESRDVATQQGFKPCFRCGAIEGVTTIGRRRRSMLAQVAEQVFPVIQR